MLVASTIPYKLSFIRTARTSRAIMNDKETYFIRILDSDNPGKSGIGEAALFRGLSAEDTPQYRNILSDICANIDTIDIASIKESSIRFGIETALSDLKNGGCREPFFSGAFTPIRINGLVWMGDSGEMAAAAQQKIEAGFRCIKLKIGGIDFSNEVAILRTIRNRYPADILEIRLDANGAFQPEDALRKLDVLSKFDIHSVEQPIRAGQHEQMARICSQSPIPIALDEELIGITSFSDKIGLLNLIKPAYIILKPSLCGGFAEADQWIKCAEDAGIGWWATSALESNIGLNAIARWICSKAASMPQGLGTGMLYSNNVASPLTMHGEHLCYNPAQKWDESTLEF